MNYYDEIKQELINNEVSKKVKNYIVNKSELEAYYNVGKILDAAGKKYGEGIIKEYSKKLQEEIGKKYSVRYLFDIRKLYYFSKVHPLGAQLTISHYRILFTIKNKNEIDYYINQIIERKLSKRELINIIKNKEYDRLPKETKSRLINKENFSIIDFVKNPIIIKNPNNYEIVSEKVLHSLILNNIESFMNELGNSFSFIGSEYKIKLGDKYNYIDLLLYNIKYKCYVVIELKITELKKDHIGQIQTYMTYIDKNVKSFEESKTIGIIICKRNNEYIMEYCSDKRILSKEYILIK